MPEILNKDAVEYGCWQYGPIVTDCGATLSSARLGKGQFTKNTVPGSVKTREEPNATVLSTFFAARYTQERSARLKGISSRSWAKKYCLKNSPICSKI